jgi:rhodanese-related sulfurtransferase
MMKNDFFDNKGFDSRGVHNLTPAETLALCKEKGAVLIDVRENYHSFLHTFDVPLLYYCPASELKTHFDKIPTDIPVIIADASGLKSVEAVATLLQEGFNNVANLAGGMLEWNKEEKPVISDKQQRISGGCMCMLKYREADKGQSLKFKV